jgi:hypothetical protein
MMPGETQIFPELSERRLNLGYLETAVLCQSLNHIDSYDRL